MKEHLFSLAVTKLEKVTKGRNAGKYKEVLIHTSFKGTWDELEAWLAENRYTLQGWDTPDEEETK